MPLAPGQSLVVRGRSSKPGTFEQIEQFDHDAKPSWGRPVIIAWHGCTIEAFVDGELAFGTDIAIPFPERTSIREIKTLLGLFIDRSRPGS